MPLLGLPFYLLVFSFLPSLSLLLSLTLNSYLVIRDRFVVLSVTDSLGIIRRTLTTPLYPSQPLALRKNKTIPLQDKTNNHHDTLASTNNPITPYLILEILLLSCLYPVASFKKLPISSFASSTQTTNINVPSRPGSIELRVIPNDSSMSNLIYKSRSLRNKSPKFRQDDDRDVHQLRMRALDERWGWTLDQYGEVVFAKKFVNDVKHEFASMGVNVRVCSKTVDDLWNDHDEDVDDLDDDVNLSQLSKTRGWADEDLEQEDDIDKDMTDRSRNGMSLLDLASYLLDSQVKSSSSTSKSSSASSFTSIMMGLLVQIILIFFIFPLRSLISRVSGSLLLPTPPKKPS